MKVEDIQDVIDVLKKSVVIGDPGCMAEGSSYVKISTELVDMMLKVLSKDQ